jgi:hypothetical protein
MNRTVLADIAVVSLATAVFAKSKIKVRPTSIPSDGGRAVITPIGRCSESHVDVYTLHLNATVSLSAITSRYPVNGESRCVPVSTRNP